MEVDLGVFDQAVLWDIKEREYNTTKNIGFTLFDPHIPEGLAGATIKMWIKKPGTHTPSKEVNTEEGHIVITDTAACTFSVIPFFLDVPAGLYVYDIKIFYAGGQQHTRFEGKYEICNTATKC